METLPPPDATEVPRFQPPRQLSPHTRLILAAWADALDSGEYRQGRNRLATVEQGTEEIDKRISYCCLGVLYEVAIAHGFPATRHLQPASHVQRETEGIEGHVDYVTEDGYANTMPRGDLISFMEMEEYATAGAYDELCDIPITRECTAAQANDDLACTFSEIADDIRLFYSLGTVA